MPETAENSVSSWIFRLNPTSRWSFKAVVLPLFLGILIVWGIDGWSIGNFHRDLGIFKLFNSKAPTQENLTFPEIPHWNLTHTHQNLTQTHEDLSPNTAPPIPTNLTQNQLNFTDFSPQHQPNLTNFSSQNPLNLINLPNPNLDWISAKIDPNYTSNIIVGWLNAGGEPCKDQSRTVEISIPSLDGHENIELSTGNIHEFVFQALDESGKPSCSGGDYFETDLSGERWKSRPPIKDFGNGTYSFNLQVHQDFAGDYNFTIILLFRRFEGLKLSPKKFAFDKQLRKISIKFLKSSAQLLELTTCKSSDFTRASWSGRWTRHGNNKNCPIDNEGRFRCLEPNFSCPNPWCYGSLGILESNGWTYSAHCSFKLFSSETAWNCLKGRWIFFWGDSNHQDTTQNILHFILDVAKEITALDRRFDMNFTNPKDPSQIVRITSIFNGHPNMSGNFQGLNSLEDFWYRESLKQYFSGETVPDAIIMNSGLHDGFFWPDIRRFAKGVERAALFWAEVMESVKKRGLVAPEVIYRSTVAVGGFARKLEYNPQKMEAYNGVFVEKLREFGMANPGVVDDFDMTYPWHYDNRCNDGIHYGRGPWKSMWIDGQIGHQYFVDLMLCHVLLNALCVR